MATAAGWRQYGETWIAQAAGGHVFFWFRHIHPKNTKPSLRRPRRSHGRDLQLPRQIENRYSFQLRQPATSLGCHRDDGVGEAAKQKKYPVNDWISFARKRSGGIVPPPTSSPPGQATYGSHYFCVGGCVLCLRCRARRKKREFRAKGESSGLGRSLSFR